MRMTQRSPMDSSDPILPIDRIELSDAMESSELRDQGESRDVLSEAMSVSLGQPLSPRPVRRASTEDTATLVRCRS